MIWLVSTDGYWDSVIQEYASDEEDIKSIITRQRADLFEVVRDIKVDFVKKEVCFESRGSWSGVTEEDWEPSVYHLIPVEKAVSEEEEAKRKKREEKGAREMKKRKQKRERQKRKYGA